MALKYAPFCARCNTHRTKNNTGICSRCLRSCKRNPCRACGVAQTDHPSGLCYKCRTRTGELHNLDKAIEHHETILRALKLLKEKNSYQKIGQEVGMSKSGVYLMCQTALSGPFVNEGQGLQQNMGSGEKAQ